MVKRYLNRIVYILVGIVLLNVNHSNAIIPKEHLIAYWNFDDGTAMDQSGNNYNGIIRNFPKKIPGVNRINKAFHFTGQGYESIVDEEGKDTLRGDFIELPYIDFKNLNEFTITLWVKEIGLSMPNHGEAYIWFGNQATGWIGIDHCRQHSVPEPSFNVIINYTSGSKLKDTITPISVPFDSTTERNKWILYTLVYNNGEMSVYKNNQFFGKKLQSNNVEYKTAGLAVHWWVKDSMNKVSSRFIGDIDEVMIFNKALTIDEINEIYLVGDYYTFCKGNNVVLTAPDGFIDYKWSNGTKGKQMVVDEAGTYYLNVISKEGVSLKSKPYIVEEMKYPLNESDNPVFFYGNMDRYLLDTIYISNDNRIPIVIDSIFFLHNDYNELDYFINGNFPLEIDSGTSESIIMKYTPNSRKSFKDSMFLSIAEPCQMLSPVKIVTVNQECNIDKGFTYYDFANTDNIIIKGNAEKGSKIVCLTESKQNQLGYLWFNDLVSVSSGFTTSFKFRIKDGNNYLSDENSLPGGDGFAFIIQNTGMNILSKQGGWLGYSFLNNSLAVEYDLFSDDSLQLVDLKDPNGNHVAVQSNGIFTNSAAHNDSITLGINSDIPLLQSDGTIYYSKIDYNIQLNNLRVFLDTTDVYTRPILEIDSLEIGKLLDLFEGEMAYIGFSASTGNVSEKFEILSWDFCPVPAPVDVNEKDNYQNKSKTISISAEPNPFEERIVFRVVSGVYKPFTLKVFSLLGEEVFSFTGQDYDRSSWNVTWESTGTKPGYYLYVLTSGNEKAFGKILKI